MSSRRFKLSKEFIAVYKCDRCGKQMDSQYAILTLKHAGVSLVKDDLVNKDLCIDCYDEIKRAMDKNYVVLHKGFTNYITASPLDKVASIPASAITDSSSNRGTYVT